MADPPWSGLDLSHAEQERVAATVERIASTIADTPEPSLALGTAGHAVLAAHLGDEDRSAALAERALLDAVARADVGAGLHEGIAGPAWAASHVFDLDPDDDPLAAVGEALTALLDDGWDGPFDLMGGLVGIGVYARERRDEALLGRVVDALVARADPAWHTPPDHLPEHRRAAAPDGVHDLGLAHGTPGVLALLAHVPRASDVLDAGVDWLLAHDDPDGFPSWVGGDRARTAWCYGDPGIAMALLQAGADDDGQRIARRAAARTPEDLDAAICHGSAGLAHVFARAAQRTGDDLLHDAARRWLVHALDHVDRLEDDSLLEGRTGVALVLHAALGNEPTWDRILLLS